MLLLAHLFSSFGRELEGGLRGSSGRKKVPRLFTMRSHVGGAFIVSMKPLKNATCRVDQNRSVSCQVHEGLRAGKMDKSTWVGTSSCISRSIAGRRPEGEDTW